MTTLDSMLKRNKDFAAGQSAARELMPRALPNVKAVTQSATMARDFVPDGSDKKLLDLPLTQTGMSENKDNPVLSEWVVGVQWKKIFERDQAKRFPGMFANQNIVCQLRDTATADFLRKEFSVTSS